MTDFLLDSNGELLLTPTGDIAIGTSDAQHVQHIIECAVGSFKDSPLLGYGSERLLNGSLDGKARRDIQSALLADGYKLSNFNVVNGNISVEI